MDSHKSQLGGWCPLTNSEWNIPIKDLFDMLEGLRQDVTTLRTELTQTRADVKAYNGLGPRLSAVEQRLNELERFITQAKGRSQVYEAVRTWLPVIVGMAGFYYGFLRG